MKYQSVSHVFLFFDNTITVHSTIYIFLNTKINVLYLHGSQIIIIEQV